MGSQQIICRVCDASARQIFVTKVLRKYDVSYYECSLCKCVQTESPYWLEEAYSTSINAEDTGLLTRNTIFAERLSVLLYSLIGPSGQFVDYAGGYGVFTRMMRDRGFDFYWSDKYTKNILAQGFEYQPNKKIDALTVFEAFEHFVDPAKELEHLLSIANVVVFSTELMSVDTPPAGDWWYYGHQHGQHICFYRLATLEALAKKFALRCYSNGQNLHVFMKENIAPFCVEDKYFARLNAQTGGQLNEIYSPVVDRTLSRHHSGRVKQYLDALRGKRYWQRNADVETDAALVAVSRLADGSDFNEYVQQLLAGDVRKWGRLLQGSLVSKTFSDMQFVIDVNKAAI